jgi:AcrR family transcriptional regulator
LRQVAEEIGYTPTTIYLYFKDKDDLLLHVAYEGFKLFGESLEKAYRKEKTPLERLEATGWAYFHFAMSHPIHYRLMFMQRGEFLQRKPEGYQSIIDSFAVLQRIVEESTEAKIMLPGNARIYSALIWSSVHGIVSLALTDSFNKKEAEQLFSLQMKAIKRAHYIKG